MQQAHVQKCRAFYWFIGLLMMCTSLDWLMACVLLFCSLLYLCVCNLITEVLHACMTVVLNVVGVYEMCVFLCLDLIDTLFGSD